MECIPTIGLEIHAELNTRTKMFCASPNDPDETRPNTHICPICLGHPGTLPVINRNAVEKVIRVGLALNGAIAEFSQFDRKNYFYPDLPKGYQISQYEHPLVKGGYLDIQVTPQSAESQFPISNFKFPDKSKIQNPNAHTRRIRIRRIHLEEDTGRLIHDPKAKTTRIDFNRAGVPLMELVTEPDLQSSEEVRQFGEELQKILRYLGASDADMEKGEMRVEVNISLSPPDASMLGTKVELKNINSFKFAASAVDYEIKRQSALLGRGEKIVQETRGWDAAGGKTVSQRVKEESHDYRYFPEPDLPPLKIDPAFVEELRAGLPELPHAKLRRFREEFAIPAGLAETIVRDRRLAAFFEAAVSELKGWLSSETRHFDISKFRNAMRLAANYLTTDVVRILVGTGTSIHESPMTPENFAELITYLADDKISSHSAKSVLKEMISSGADPSVFIEEQGLWQTSDAGALQTAVERAIAEHPKAAADYQAGKGAALHFLVGQVMKGSRGANPEAVRTLLKEQLK